MPRRDNIHFIVSCGYHGIASLLLHVDYEVVVSPCGITSISVSLSPWLSYENMYCDVVGNKGRGFGSRMPMAGWSN